METTKQRLGRRVRDVRKARGFRSAESLAEALGMHPNSVYDVERGENWVSPEMLEGLARVLKVSPAAFFDDQETAKATAPTDTRESILGRLVVAATALDQDELLDLLTLAEGFPSVRGLLDSGELRRKSGK